MNTIKRNHNKTQKNITYENKNKKSTETNITNKFTVRNAYDGFSPVPRNSDSMIALSYV